MKLGRRAEFGTVAAVAVLLTALANLEQVRTLARTAPGDLGDPLYFAWQLAWIGHALRTDPAGIYTTNAFQRAPDNLAYTDIVFGYAPLSVLMPEGQDSALAQLNLATLIATATAGFGAYVLARVLGARAAGAMVAGAGFAFAPWRLTHVIHINVLSTGGIALAIAVLLFGHGWSLRHGWRPERMRPGWVFTGWAVAAWQLCFGFALGIWFAYSLALVMLLLAGGWLVSGRRRMPRLPGRLLLADGVGGLGFLAVAVVLVQPYLRVLAANPDAQRSPRMLDLFSPPWFGLLTPPPTTLVWGDQFGAWQSAVSWPPEMHMSPGLVLLGLAVIGLFVSAWPLRRRLVLGAATAVVVVLAMGTRFPGGGRFTYLPLYEFLPGWANLRTPGRLMVWVTLGLGLLAAGAVSAAVDAWLADSRRRGRGARAGLAVGLLLPAALVVGEGLNTVPHWEVSRSPVRLAALPQPILILPSALVADYHLMLWSTEGWPVMANGDSGFDASGQAALREDARSFPDPASLQAVRGRGIATVVVVRSRVEPGLWDGAADASVDGLDLTRQDLGDAVVFDVRPGDQRG